MADDEKIGFVNFKTFEELTNAYIGIKAKLKELEQKIESLFMSIHGIKPDEVDKFKEHIENLEEKYQQILDSRSVWLTSIKTELSELKAFSYNQSDDKWIVIKNIESVLKEHIKAHRILQEENIGDWWKALDSQLEKLSEGDKPVPKSEEDFCMTDMDEKGNSIDSFQDSTPSELSEHDKKIMREMIPQADEIIYDETPSETSYGDANDIRIIAPTDYTRPSDDSFEMPILYSEDAIKELIREFLDVYDEFHSLLIRIRDSIHNKRIRGIIPEYACILEEEIQNYDKDGYKREYWLKRLDDE